jgi:TRAP-type uncharacterized transport system fused permease subunit
MATAFCGMFGLSIGLEGFMLHKIATPWRLAAVVGGLCLVNPGLWTDIVGFILIGAVVATQVIGAKRKNSEPPPITA